MYEAHELARIKCAINLVSAARRRLENAEKHLLKLSSEPAPYFKLKYEVAPQVRSLEVALRNTLASDMKGEAVMDEKKKRNKMKSAKCPYPHSSCTASRNGACCRECNVYEFCAHACQNTPDKCRK